MFDDAWAVLQEKYGERGVPTEWTDITPEVMSPAFRLHFRALKSPSGDPDGADGEAEELIHNPVKALRRYGLISEDETPRVSTMIVNHEKTLERFIVYAMVLVSTNPSTVGITLAKEEEPKEAGE
ncbi:MAG TPA: hypothetical protein VL687_06100 [Methylomirabilota bacterium]|nr:hypothetical protein [Methylomirabilota bacterium]